MRLPADLRRVFANAGWLLGGKGVGALLSIIYIALATRTLGLEEFGRFALVVALGQAIAGLVTFQTWQFVVRYGAAARMEGDVARVERIVAFASMLDLASAAVGGVLAAAAVFALGSLLDLPAELRPLVLGFCGAMLLSIRSTPIGILRLENRFRDAAAADAVTPVVRVIGAVWAAYASPDVAGFLLAWAVAELCTAGAYWRLALQSCRLAPSFQRLRRTSREEDKIWRFVFATNAGASLSMTIRQVTLLSVGGVAGPAAAGAYRLAAQLAQSLAKFTQSLQQAIYPELVRSLAKGAAGQERRLLLGMSGIAIAAGAATLGLAVLIGRPALQLIAGPQFVGAYEPMLLLVAAAALDFCALAYEPALTARGRAELVLLVRIASTAMQLLLLAFLLTEIGAIGAAWAVLGGSAVALILSAWQVFR